MRVGFLSYDYDPPIGGLGVHVLRLVETLERLTKGDEFLVLSPSKDARLNVSLLARRFWRRRGGAPIFSFTLFFRLRSYVRWHKIDVVHAQGGSGGVLLLKRPKVPVIVTAHHTYLDEAEVYQGRKLTYLRKWLFSRLERRTYMIADKVVCVSEDTRQTLMSRYRIPSERLTVIENSIALDLFEGEPPYKEHAMILFIGRLEPRKGLPILLEAFGRLHKRHPRTKLRIIGENMLGSTLQELIERHQIGAHVEVLGHVTENERVRQLRSATMLVVPSIVEGFGLVAAEAMAAGTAVVASDCPGLRSVVTHGKTGLLFTTGSVEACEQAMEQCLMHPDDRKKWQEAARSDAWERFSTVRQAKRTLAVYADVLSAKIEQ